MVSGAEAGAMPFASGRLFDKVGEMTICQKCCKVSYLAVNKI